MKRTPLVLQIAESSEKMEVVSTTNALAYGAHCREDKHRHVALSTRESDSGKRLILDSTHKRISRMTEQKNSF